MTLSISQRTLASFSILLLLGTVSAASVAAGPAMCTLEDALAPPSASTAYDPPAMCWADGAEQWFHHQSTGRAVCDPAPAADTRGPAVDPGTARLVDNVLAANPGNACTGWITDRAPLDDPGDRCLITAGHCFPAPPGVAVTTAQFNAPASNADCTVNRPLVPGSDEFAITRKRLVDNGAGDDYAVLRVGRNVLAETAFEHQVASHGLPMAYQLIAPVVGAANEFSYGADGDPPEAAVIDNHCVCMAGDVDAPNNLAMQAAFSAVTLVAGTAVHYDIPDCPGSSGAAIDLAAYQAMAIDTLGACVIAPPALFTNVATSVAHEGVQYSLLAVCPTLDDFLCYSAKPDVTTEELVTLVDQFEDGEFDVRTARALCTPSFKARCPDDAPANPLAPCATEEDCGGVTGTTNYCPTWLDDVTHLKRYPVRRFDGAKHIPRFVAVADQFGSRVLKTKKPTVLMVPTNKSLDPMVTPPPPNPIFHNVDHFLCYRVSVVPGPICSSGAPVNARGACAQELDCGGINGLTRYCTPSAKFAGDLPLVVDQFGARSLPVLKPFELCNPVNKNAEGIKEPDRHLVCYKVKGGFPGTTVAVNNQFGPEILEVGKEKVFCVPAGKRVL